MTVKLTVMSAFIIYNLNCLRSGFFFKILKPGMESGFQHWIWMRNEFALRRIRTLRKIQIWLHQSSENEMTSKVTGNFIRDYRFSPIRSSGIKDTRIRGSGIIGCGISDSVSESLPSIGRGGSGPFGFRALAGSTVAAALVFLAYFTGNGQCCGSGSTCIRIHLTVFPIRIRIQVHQNLQINLVFCLSKRL